MNNKYICENCGYKFEVTLPVLAGIGAIIFCPKCLSKKVKYIFKMKG